MITALPAEDAILSQRYILFVVSNQYILKKDKNKIYNHRKLKYKKHTG